VKAEGHSGWAALPGYAQPQTLPDGIKALSNYVSVPEVLARRLSQVGLVDRTEGARRQPELKPGQRLVSVEGDLWRWDGFRTASEDAPSATALRMQQLNRLQELKQDLEEVGARAAGAEQAHALLKRRLAETTEADRAAREARRAADQKVTEASRALSRAEADRNIAAGKLESSRLAEARHSEEAAAALERLRQAEAALRGLGDLDAARAEAEDVRVTVEAARMTMMTRRSSLDELRRTGEARHRRLTDIARDRGNWLKRLETAEARMAELQERREAADRRLTEAKAAPDRIRADREVLTSRMGEAETRRRKAADALAAGETALRDATAAERDAERAASIAREGRAGSEARHAAAKEAVAAAAARIAEELETTPEALFESLATTLDLLPSASALEADVHRLRRQRDALGAVNLRAEEDAAEVQAEYDALVTERTDLQEAIATLRTAIANLNREGRERLLTAFEQVNTNFSMLFTHLFNGGEAKLVLVESDDPLEAGLEIMCQPPGKKLATLSLLSGGEQTLTALALIFAVFLANPAPICVLDEVDAPLDDANVTRFCDLLDEMTRRTDTRFLIITHHAVTMSRMDRLFGVTMAEQGVSQLVSVDLRKAEALVA
jgi:chromosome segregation protein